jgi:hypothetical protein
MSTLDNRFTNTPDSRGHYWEADGSGFQEDTRQSFPMRRKQKSIECFHGGRDVPSPSGKMQSLTKPIHFNQRLNP